MLARGEQGLHQLHSLRIVGSNGKGKGFKYERRDLSSDPLWIRKFIDTLKSLLEILEDRLEALGETVDREDREQVEEIRETISTLERSPILRRSVNILERSPILHRDSVVLRPMFVERVPIVGGVK